MSGDLRVMFALPGLHRVIRGAETAFEAVARELARIPGFDVTLIGSGPPAAGMPYEYRRVSCIGREWFERVPALPGLRSHYAWEELTFAPGLARVYSPRQFDVTVTCGYPFANWVLRARRDLRRRPRHVFVTQNGDWMCQSRDWEFRFFGCDGLICTNPEYFQRNQQRWRSVLIPNGVDPRVYRPEDGGGGRGGGGDGGSVGGGDGGVRAAMGIAPDALVVLMVSALIPSKRVIEGISAVAKVDGAHLIVAGDGELRQEVRRIGRELMGERFVNVQLPREKMPELYRSAKVFLHMSQDEPSANAYLEALATGLPIVTEDRAVTRWTLEDCAVMLATDDLSAVARAIAGAAALTDPVHIARRRALVEKRFAWSNIAADYGRFFRQVIT